MSQPPLITLHVPPLYVPLEKRTGKLPFTLTNDYLLKILLQKNEDILCALLRSLLSLPPDAIHSVVIMNTIEPGTVITDKSSILDIKLILNDRQILNLEMQVKNEHNWPERSLSYLCRSFDNVSRGQDYVSVLPVHHIGILNFSLDGLPRQFYSHYYLTEQHTYTIYTTKFRLSVFDLTQAVLATEADKQHHLHLWAAAFRATTWEEFYMIAKEDVLFQKVADALYIVLENRELAEQIRRQWEAEATKKRLEEEQRQREAEYQQREVEYKQREAEYKRQKAEDQQLIAQNEQRIAQDQQRIAQDQQRIAEYQQREAEYQQREAALKAKLAQFEAAQTEL